MANGARKLLKALDTAKTQWCHFSAIAVAGMGFFADAYDLFSITTVTKLLGRLYYYDPTSRRPGVMPANVLAAVNGVALCGTVAGQVFFGWLGDKMGRKKVFGITLSLMIFSSIGSGLSFGYSAQGVMTTLCFFRFWLGFGIGGDYPLSATIMAEYANKKTRGSFIAAVFAMQGAGIVAASTVSLIVAKAFGTDGPSYKTNPMESTPTEADFIWRTIFMVGAFPAVLALYSRMTMCETIRYTALIARDITKATQDMQRVLAFEIPHDEEDQSETITSECRNAFGLFSKEFAKRHGIHLIGTTTSWFLVDIAFYSQNLYQMDVFAAIGWIPRSDMINAVEEVYLIGRSQALIALFSTIPGYCFTVVFVDSLGRKKIQMMGFTMMAVFMLAAAIPYNQLKERGCGERKMICHGKHAAFLLFYALSFFFTNFGPNSTTFIIPAELFPARMRSTCHGISAAAGKAGAIVGTFGFLYVSQNKHPWAVHERYKKGVGLRGALIITAITNLLGIATTMLVPETKGRSLEEIAREIEGDLGTS